MRNSKYGFRVLGGRSTNLLSLMEKCILTPGQDYMISDKNYPGSRGNDFFLPQHLIFTMFLSFSLN